MHLKIVPILLMVLAVLIPATANGQDTQVDVLVVGGSTSGVAAGIQSARMGASTLIVEETPWLGGMLTTAGVSAVDGNYHLQSGIWGEFLDSLATHYGSLEALKTGWVSNVLFEPSIGNKIFHEMVHKEAKLTVRNFTTVGKIYRENGLWKAETCDSAGQKQKIVAKVVIDATELGDIARLCGVKYDVGMESRHDTGEDIAPEQANDIVQDLTYTAILKDYGRNVTIPRPEGYAPEEFACCCTNLHCISPKEPNRTRSKEMMLSYGKLPNGKYMINWPIEGNDYYLNLIEQTREQRKEALKKAKLHTLRFLYFIQHELGYNTLGLADDEFPTEDRLPFIPYHRESRRTHGLVRFTLNHITQPYVQPEKLYRTCIAVGDYPIDQHHTRYHGYETLPDLHFHPVFSFGLPLGTLLPQGAEGLIVAEKSISVSNIVNGTTRLQPVVLQIGQAAGALAALAIAGKQLPHEVPVRRVQDAILEAGGYLLPYLDVPVDSPLFKPLQRIGSTGILKGTGRTIDWSNQTWLRADTLLLTSELEGLTEIYPSAAKQLKSGARSMTVHEAVALVEAIAAEEHLPHNVHGQVEELWKIYGLTDFSWQRNILRGEMAVLIDHILDPFHRKVVNIKGGFQK